MGIVLDLSVLEEANITDKKPVLIYAGKLLIVFLLGGIVHTQQPRRVE